MLTRLQLVVAPLAKAHSFTQGLSIETYNKARVTATDFLYPPVGKFPALYGKTFKEVRDGRRNSGPVATIEEVRVFCKGLTKTQYSLARTKQAKLTQKLYPQSSKFPAIYGMTYKEVKDGRGYGGAVASIEEIRSFIQGLTTEQYSNSRPRTGKLYPDVGDFPSHYQMTFKEIRDGARRGCVPPLEEMVTFTQGLSQIEYDKARKTAKDRFYPHAGEFTKYYGKTYQEVRDGRKRSVGQPIPTPQEMIRFIQGLSVIQYNNLRVEYNSEDMIYPHSTEFTKRYGMTFAKLRDSKISEI